MAQRRYTPDEITAVFIAPEVLQRQRLAQLVEEGASAQRVAEAAQQTSSGEYREYLGEQVIEGQFHTKLGRLLQWVDAAPDDPRDGTGFYQVVEESPDYKPVLTGDEAREVVS